MKPQTFPPQLILLMILFHTLVQILQIAKSLLPSISQITPTQPTLLQKSNIPSMPSITCASDLPDSTQELSLSHNLTNFNNSKTLSTISTLNGINSQLMEIILFPDNHYNPNSSNDALNPSWIIITCNLVFDGHTHFFYNQTCNSTEGAIVGKGQLNICNGQTQCIASSPFQPLSENEIINFDLTSFISSELVLVKQYDFSLRFDFPNVYEVYNTQTLC